MQNIPERGKTGESLCFHRGTLKRTGTKTWIALTIFPLLFTDSFCKCSLLVFQFAPLESFPPPFLSGSGRMFKLSWLSGWALQKPSLIVHSIGMLFKRQLYAGFNGEMISLDTRMFSDHGLGDIPKDCYRIFHHECDIWDAVLSERKKKKEKKKNSCRVCFPLAHIHTTEQAFWWSFYGSAS